MGGEGPAPGVTYSPPMGLIYIFNLIVGTGALTLPAAFHDAGTGGERFHSSHYKCLKKIQIMTFRIQYASEQRAITIKVSKIFGAGSGENNSDLNTYRCVGFCLMNH